MGKKLWGKRRITMNPTFVCGVPRSGTTHLWGLLSCDPEFKPCYCEPLHPALPTQGEHWKHYQGYPSKALSLHHPGFGSDFYLDPNIVDTELENYLKELLVANSLSKFIRINQRIAWLANCFPESFIIPIVRDPRSVCCSVLSGYDDIFSPDISWSGFGYDSQFEDSPAYIKIFSSWKNSLERLEYLDKIKHNYILVNYEDLCALPEDVMSVLYDRIGRKVPKQVLNAITKGFGDLERPWQKPTSTLSIDTYEKYDANKLAEGIEVTGAEPLMISLGYGSV
jgi:hypothetical protein